MKLKRYIILMILAAFLLPNAVLAGTSMESVFYKGDIALTLDKDTYMAGEEIRCSISVHSLDNATINNASLILQINKGCENPTYPAQFSDCDNIFLEEKIPEIYLAPEDNSEVQVKIQLPQDLEGGLYRIDAYLKTKRTPIVGIPFIFASPKDETFRVEGDGNFPSAKIIRTETRFKGTSRETGEWSRKNMPSAPYWPWLRGQIGAFITPDMEEVRGMIYVKNNLNEELTDLTLEALICEWDDTSCDNITSINTETFTLPPATTKPINITLKPPEKSGAYAIRISVKKDSRLISLFRNRIIVEGETARIRKLSVDKPYHNAGEEGSLSVTVGTTPDHYTRPTIRNPKLKVTVEDLENNKIILSESKTIPELSKNNILDVSSFTFTPTQTLKKFRVSAQVLSEEGQLYDTHTYIVDSGMFHGPIENVELEETYYYDNTLTVKFCIYGRSSTPTKGELLILMLKGGDLLKKSCMEADNCVLFTHPATPGEKFTFIVNCRKQFKFDVVTPKETIKPPTTTITTSTSTLTPTTTGPATTSTHTPTTSVPSGEEDGGVIFALIAVVIIILAAAVILKVKSK